MASIDIRRAGRRVINLLYPPACALCDAGGAFLCARCEAGLPRADGPRCSRCWMPLRAGSCAACAEHLPAYASLRSSLRYEGEVRRLVQAFKFKDQTSLAEDLGRLLSETLLKVAPRPNVIVPVPLTGLKQRQRGFNQAVLLARQAAKASGLPVLQALERRGGRVAQSQAEDAGQRRQNVAGAFALRRHAHVAGLQVLLLDDVATTGATLDSCARALLDGGARRVDALTLARED